MTTEPESCEQVAKDWRCAMTIPAAHSHKPVAGRPVGLTGLDLLLAHGAPIVLVALLWWMLWWGHTPNVQTTDEAMRHVSWVGLAALVYVALQARSVLAQPRRGVVHSMIGFLVSLLPLFTVGFALLDWMRGNHPLSVFQVIVMGQAALATLIDVVILNWFALRLSKLSIDAVETHQR